LDEGRRDFRENIGGINRIGMKERKTRRRRGKIYK
jgi:hypothetical protein